LILISSSNTTISAFIPCFNHWDTIDCAVKSIENQSIHVSEILIVDDGSYSSCSDRTLTGNTKVKIIRLNKNMGRGYCRNLAFQKTSSEYVVHLDATNVLDPCFIEKALPHFTNSRIAAVSGALVSKHKKKFVDRWRARHLFREANLKYASAEPCAMLITYGTIFRRSAIEKVGGFNQRLRFKEDQEMGERLYQAGYQIIGDPKIKIYPSKSNTVCEVLERYSRWYMDADENPSLKAYFHNLKASIRIMIRQDIKEGDWTSAILSLLAPHFQLYHSIKTSKTKHENF
jgi:GT2 family glycosyltransferase